MSSHYNAVGFFIAYSVKLFTGVLALYISKYSYDELYEIRLRLNRPAVLKTKSGTVKLRHDSGRYYIVTKEDIDRVVGVSSGFSVYSVTEELVSGYLRYEKGVRIGAVGEGVVEGGRLISLKSVSSLLIRLPHEIKGIGDRVKAQAKGAKNILVISPPGCGKTTLLRDLARAYSKECQTLIIDERGELAASSDGVPCLDVGECDVVANVPKIIAYENCVRAMSPELIVTDEIFKRGEIEAVKDIVRAGVRVFASVHASGADDLTGDFKLLKETFDCHVVLSDKPSVGHIEKIDLRGEN